VWRLLKTPTFLPSTFFPHKIELKWARAYLKSNIGAFFEIIWYIRIFLLKSIKNKGYFAGSVLAFILISAAQLLL
jgi:hypothetical protein